jgi:tetratricopeptide (TPR) repeat protein
MGKDHNHSQENNMASSHICHTQSVSLRDRFIMLFLVLAAVIAILKPNFWEAYSWLGFAYQKDKQINKAIDAYSKAIQLNPKDKQACFELGLICFRKKNFEKAAFYFGKVTTIDPNDLNTKNLEALSYERMGKTEEAILIWKAILKSNLKFMPAKRNLKRLETKEKNLD